jgi:hypothetical protein
MLDIDTLKTLDAATDAHDPHLQERVLRTVRTLDETRPVTAAGSARLHRSRGHRLGLVALPIVAAVAVFGGYTAMTGPSTGQVVLAAPSSADLSAWQSTPLPVIDPVKERNACLSASKTDLGTSTEARYLLEERRGAFTSMIATYQDQTVFCIVNADDKGLLDSMSSLPYDVTDQPSTGLTQAVSGGRLDGPVDARQNYATGRAAVDVTDVTLTLDDGQLVTASLEDGWFAAWWPGAATSATATVTWTLSDGTTENSPFSDLAY